MWLPKSNHPRSLFFESTMFFHRFGFFFKTELSLPFIQTYFAETYSHERYRNNNNRQMTDAKIVYEVLISFPINSIYTYLNKTKDILVVLRHFV